MQSPKQHTVKCSYTAFCKSVDPGQFFFLDFVAFGRPCPSGKERDSISEMLLFLDVLKKVEVCCRGRNRTRRTVII